VADRNNNLYVGDRTNRRVQVFDTDGKFLRMFTIDVRHLPPELILLRNTPSGERPRRSEWRSQFDRITPAPTGAFHWRNYFPRANF